MNPQPARQKARTRTKPSRKAEGKGHGATTGALRREHRGRRGDSAWMKEIVLSRSRALPRCGGHQKDWVVVVGAS